MQNYLSFNSRSIAGDVMRQVISMLVALLVLCSFGSVSDLVNALDSSYVLSSDTTWIAGSKQVLMSSWVVPRGVTLTIEAGVTVDVLYSSLRIEGTLIARGTNQSRILFTTTANKNHSLYPHGLPHPLYIAPSSQGSILENVDIADPIGIDATVSVTGCSLGIPIVDGGLSVISNSHLDDIHLLDGSPTVVDNTITEMTISGGVPTVANNTINGKLSIWGGSPAISKNSINGRTDVSLNPTYVIGSPVLSDNQFFAPIGTATPYIEVWENNKNRSATLTIVNNVLTVPGNPIIGISDGIFVNVSYNKIVGTGNAKTAINIQDSSGTSLAINFKTGAISNIYIGATATACIVGNQISNCQTGIDVHHSNVQITKNTVFNNTIGVCVNPSYFDHAADKSTIGINNNTITNNSVGIEYIDDRASKILTAPLPAMNLTAPPPLFATANISDYQTPVNIKNNDISTNSEYNFMMTGNETRKSVDATNNWWGTSDASAIGRSIYDSKNDPNLGTVAFTPFIIISQSDSSLQLPSTGQTIMQLVIVAVIGSVILVTAILVYRRQRSRLRNTSDKYLQ